MSVSKYRYTEECEGKPCVGDCDLCHEWESFEDDEDMEEDSVLEVTGTDTAIPTRKCIYPMCEACEAHVKVNGRYYCTVPIVVSKQMYLDAIELRSEFERRLCAVEELYLYPQKSRENGKFEREDDAQITWDMTDAPMIQLGED